MSAESAKHIGYGLCWLGFWIGLGLYNFQGCTPQVKVANEARQEMSRER